MALDGQARGSPAPHGAHAMEIYPCKCNFGIPGVESLPNHTHHYVTTWLNGDTNEVKVAHCHPRVGAPVGKQWICQEIEDSVTIWIDYEKLARALMAL